MTDDVSFLIIRFVIGTISSGTAPARNFTPKKPILRKKERNFGMPYSWIIYKS